VGVSHLQAQRKGTKKYEGESRKTLGGVLETSTSLGRNRGFVAGSQEIWFAYYSVEGRRTHDPGQPSKRSTKEILGLVRWKKERDEKGKIKR